MENIPSTVFHMKVSIFSGLYVSRYVTSFSRWNAFDKTMIWISASYALASNAWDSINVREYIKTSVPIPKWVPGMEILISLAQKGLENIEMIYCIYT